MDSSPSATTAAYAAAAEERQDDDDALADWPTNSTLAPLSLRRNPSPVPAPGTAPGAVPSSWLEIRLFYVRVWPCAPDATPEELTLSHPRRERGVTLEVNGCRAAAHESTALPLRRDRLDRTASEATYVCTDNVRVAGPALEFEIRCAAGLVLCGTLERLEGAGVADRDAKTGWTMDCYPAPAGAATFARQKAGAAPPSVEVYVAGCCSGFPLILTRTLQLGPKKKIGGLDSIPEDEEGSEGERKRDNGLVRRRPTPLDTEGESDDYDTDLKIGHNYCPEGAYYDEDGQLTWFNAGVRVGVGIGLGMCIGVGIGVGIIMRSYQATRSTFRRRFF